MQEMSPEIKRGIRKKNFKRRGLVFLFTSPFFISFLFFIVVPLCMGLIFSFFNYNSYNIAEAKFVGFNNYIKISMIQILKNRQHNKILLHCLIKFFGFRIKFKNGF